MFKKRDKLNTDLIKTLTILDSETSKVKEIIDIVDDKVKEITLVDEKPLTTYSDSQLKDMSFMSTLRDAYPNLKDMETFLTDACKSHKLVKDEVLTDEQKLEKEKLDKIAESDAVAAKLLLDAEIKEQDLGKARQIEIEEAERKKHEAAQN